MLTYGHGDVVRGYDAQWAAPLTLDPHASKATAGTAAARPTTRASTRSTSARSRACSRRARAASASTSSSSSRPARKPARRGCMRFARRRATSSPPTCSSPPTGRAFAPGGRRCSSARAVVNFNFDLRAARRRPSLGQLGRPLANPAVLLAHAIASLVSPQGVLLVAGLRPPPLPDRCGPALADIAVGGDPGDPAVDAGWGEPGLSPPNASSAGIRSRCWRSPPAIRSIPVNAIPPEARAHCQMRFVVGTDWARLGDHLRRHLTTRGLRSRGRGRARQRGDAPSTRGPWVRWRWPRSSAPAASAGAAAQHRRLAAQRRLRAVLGLPTLWVPHSYPACSQHAPGEHLLARSRARDCS